MPQDAREIEWQFDALDLRLVSRWLGEPAGWSDAGPVRALPRGSANHVDLYLDTDDRRFQRAAYSLRIRRPMVRSADKADATLKALDVRRAGASAPRDRREISEKIAQSDPASLLLARGPVGERVRAVAGTKPLLSLFEVRTKRRVFALEAEGVARAELVLDEAAVHPPDGAPPTRLRRVEIELSTAAIPSLEPFLERLQAACGLRPAVLSKYEAGLLAANLGPPSPETLDVTEIAPDASLAEVAIAVLGRQFSVLLAKEPGARLGEDAEALHDMRVAGRRLRAALSLFADVMPEETPALRGQLGSVFRTLGAARDLDVQLEQLDEWLAEVPEPDRQPLAELRSLLEDQRKKARTSMVTALDSHEWEVSVARIGRLLGGRSARLPDPAALPARAAAPDLLQAQFRKLRRRGDRIGRHSDSADFHRVRIQAKRFRYALEFFADIYHGQTRRLVKRMIGLQDILGQHQDAEIAIARLRRLAVDHGVELDPATIFAMGEIAERYRLKTATLRAGFPPAYAHVKKGWKSLRKLLEEERPATSDVAASVRAE